MQPIAVAIGNWFFDRQVVKAIDCAYPCDNTCHNLVFKWVKVIVFRLVIIHNLIIVIAICEFIILNCYRKTFLAKAITTLWVYHIHLYVALIKFLWIENPKLLSLYFCCHLFIFEDIILLSNYNFPKDPILCLKGGTFFLIAPLFKLIKLQIGI